MENQVLVELRALSHLADVLNARQHAGLRITPAMWSELYDVTNRAKAVVAAVDRTEFGVDTERELAGC